MITQWFIWYIQGSIVIFAIFLIIAKIDKFNMTGRETEKSITNRRLCVIATLPFINLAIPIGLIIMGIERLIYICKGVGKIDIWLVGADKHYTVYAHPEAVGFWLRMQYLKGVTRDSEITIKRGTPHYEIFADGKLVAYGDKT